jgi:hypothetical protein
VGASKGVPTIETANVLAKVAWWYSGEPTGVIDLRDVTMRLLLHQLRNLDELRSHDGRMFLAMRSTLENPTSVPLARAADAVVLCVELGATDAKSAERTLDAIGRERFLGTLVLNAPPCAATKKTRKERSQAG